MTLKTIHPFPFRSANAKKMWFIGNIEIYEVFLFLPLYNLHLTLSVMTEITSNTWVIKITVQTILH